jgi:hypothetical protein
MGKSDEMPLGREIGPKIKVVTKIDIVGILLTLSRFGDPAHPVSELLTDKLLIELLINALSKE